jgi:hypothetical protein
MSPADARSAPFATHEDANAPIAGAIAHKSLRNVVTFVTFVTIGGFPMF